MKLDGTMIRELKPADVPMQPGDKVARADNPTFEERRQRRMARRGLSMGSGARLTAALTRRSTNGPARITLYHAIPVIRQLIRQVAYLPTSFPIVRCRLMARQTTDSEILMLDQFRNAGA